MASDLLTAGLEGNAGKDYLPGYDGIVELSKEIVRGRSSKEQQATVDNILASLLPPDAGKTFRKLFPFSRVSPRA